MGSALVDGEVAFREHAGGHSTGQNWSTWITWASILAILKHEF